MTPYTTPSSTSRGITQWMCKLGRVVDDLLASLGKDSGTRTEMRALRHLSCPAPEYVAQHVAKYILAKISKHVDIDADYQRRITEKAVTSACDLYRVCKGVTLKGSRCSRHVAGDADYCFQHRGMEEESSASDDENSEDEGSASEEESSGSEEESSEAETEEDSDEESSGSSEEEPSGSDEESTEDDASASEEESEGESSGESSDEEVPPPKKSKKSTKAKKTKKYRTPVEDCPAHSPQQG
ncbi:hypothetical protein AB4K20DRAFT_2019519, partial [Rhizopus microsporus]